MENFESRIVEKLVELREIIKTNPDVETFYVYFNEEGYIFYHSNICEKDGFRPLDNLVRGEQNELV